MHKTWTDLDWKRLAILYLVQDLIAEKKTLLLVGITVVNIVLTLLILLIKGVELWHYCFYSFFSL